MKRLTEIEKEKLGHLIHYYRNQYFHSKAKDSESYKQINFCKDICSQTQLSRLENGDVLKDEDIYERLLNKLHIEFEKVSSKDYVIFETYFENILNYQNDDQLIINYNEYVLLINKYQNIFKQNILFTHYNYALEFILAILNDDLEEACNLLEDVEKTVEILPIKFLVLTLHYLGIYYHLIDEYTIANKFYLLALEHMHKNNINNSIILVDIAFNYIKLNKSIYSLDYLNQAHSVFYNTVNHEILEKIYRCYGLIYIKNRYYDDGLNFLSKALSYSKNTMKSKLILSDHILLVIGLYLKRDYSKAYELISDSNLIINEIGQLLKMLIEIKLNIEGKESELSNSMYVYIKELYKNDYEEEVFESKVEPILIKIPEYLKIMIIEDMYLSYKEKKKYKKAIDLYEKYLM